jgi:energy-coupling factor transporter ATP-binding protein EcfA2
LLLLDEPSLGLAPAVVNDLSAALDRLQSEQAMSLLVDQMAGLALTLSDRAYVIESGRSLPPVPWPRSPRRARSNGPISGVVQAESGPPAIFAFPLLKTGSFGLN